ncbi:MAG: hypothetical protein ABH914_01715 [Candidatus Omnitrophota bacterium]
MPLTQEINIKKISLSQVINLIIFVVAALVAINIYKGQNNRVSEIIQIKQEQEKKNALIKKIKGLREKIAVRKTTHSVRDRREIINTITSLAIDVGVKIVSIKPEQGSGDSRIEKNPTYDKNFFNIMLEVRDYHQLGNFIGRLESDPIMFGIEFLRLNTSLSETDTEITLIRKIRVDLIISEAFFKN